MNLPTAIQTAWEYLRPGVPPEKADILFLLGNEDLRCGELAARLWHEQYAPWLVISGATGRNTSGVFKKTEAELFGEVAIACGVPESALVLETRATNTGENVRFTRELLSRRGIFPKKILAVQKPYGERRVLATLRHLWPDADIGVTSPAMSFEEYCGDGVSREEVASMLAGEIHRAIDYPKRGWMEPVPVPEEAREALRALAAAGYTRHLVPGVPLP